MPPGLRPATHLLPLAGVSRAMFSFSPGSSLRSVPTRPAPFGPLPAAAAPCPCGLCVHPGTSAPRQRESRQRAPPLRVRGGNPLSLSLGAALPPALQAAGDTGGVREAARDRDAKPGHSSGRGREGPRDSLGDAGRPATGGAPATRPPGTLAGWRGRPNAARPRAARSYEGEHRGVRRDWCPRP